MGLAPPPEEAKQHTNPSCHQERLEGSLVDLAFYGPVQILKALAPLLVDLGSRRLHGLLSLSPHVLRSLLDIGSHLLHRLFDLSSHLLHSLLDLSPYILHLCAQCLRLVMTLSARHGRVRFLHLMYVCHLSSFSYYPCFTSSRSIALEDFVS